MTTYVLRNGELVEKDLAGPPPLTMTHGAMPDIQPFVTQDGTTIGSRSALRDYEQRTGTKQIGNDYASLVRTMKGQF